MEVLVLVLVVSQSAVLIHIGVVVLQLACVPPRRARLWPLILVTLAEAPPIDRCYQGD